MLILSQMTGMVELNTFCTLFLQALHNTCTSDSSLHSNAFLVQQALVTYLCRMAFMLAYLMCRVLLSQSASVLMCVITLPYPG